MAVSPEGLRVAVDWEDAGGVRAPELHATWCRLELWVGSECITRVEEVASAASRRSIYVPLYPLAEWIAYNWWSVRADRRPAKVALRDRSYGVLVARRRQQDEWLRFHNLRSAGEGFPWPDLTLIPEGQYTRLSWTKSGDLGRGGLRYISSGEALVDGQTLHEVLTNIVELTIMRLDEAGLTATPLHEEWNALQQLTAEEALFCEASAKLGLDPFEVEKPLTDGLLLAAESLKGQVLSDFLDAVDPERVSETLSWVVSATEAVNALPMPTHVDLAELRTAVTVASAATKNSPDPWKNGYSQARATRSVLGLSDGQKYDVGSMLSIGTWNFQGRELDAVGAVAEGVRLISTRKLPLAAARFAGARGMWHALNDSAGSAFLLTRAHTWQQRTERAFAAEILAPAAGVNQLLGQLGSLDDIEEVELIAAHFEVQPLVIAHQIENQVLLDV